MKFTLLQSTFDEKEIISSFEKRGDPERFLISFHIIWSTPVFIQSGTLLFSLIPIFSTLFHKRTVLQNCTCKSECYIYEFVHFESMHNLMYHITFSIYKEATVVMLCTGFLKYLSRGRTFINTTKCLNDF